MTIQFFGSLDEIDALSQAGGTSLEDLSHLDSILESFENASFEIVGASPSITLDIEEARTSQKNWEYELGVLVYASPSEDEYQVRIQQDVSS